MLSLLFLAAVQGPTAAPAAPYWQQRVAYEIRASLDEEAGVLAGTQRLTYVNNSPDTLDRIAFHLHLNAFRPGSRWADRDSMERNRRFNDLKDPDFAFNHVRDVRVDGTPVEAIWPLAPDSTIVRFMLPRPLLPGDSIVVDMGWDARPSTFPRRQGRRGRAFDFAHSYPKVVVYDRHGWNERPLEPAGEFYGEFGTYLVELDVAADQVMGATGVPICGDPGWERVNRVPDRPVDYQRTYYRNAPTYVSVASRCVRQTTGEPRDVALAPRGPAPRKTVVWYAEDVHHWALSLNPQYMYEGTAWNGIAVHVLYRPGDEATWGGGIATQRTVVALQWLDGLFGKFAWPQITAVHRIEGGGTEFPMMMHNGSASQGLIIHELGHNYTQGILANNEWLEGWLDEGFSDFQQALFMESNPPRRDEFLGVEPFITGLDLDGLSEPASLAGHQYREFQSYGISVYTRGETFLHQLRYVVGDEAMRRILRTFYDRWKLHHVDEAAFRAVAEEVSRMNLAPFFAYGLHSTALVDYAVGKVNTRQEGGAWITTVEVLRKEEGRLPVEVWVVGERDTAMVRVEGMAPREVATVETRTKPREVHLDPRFRTRDWNMLNNSWRRGWLFATREPRRERYIDTWFSERAARDRRTEGYMPVAWYNDAGGITLGLRTRENYFGRFEQHLALLSFGTSWESDFDVEDTDLFLRFQNPVGLRHPGLRQTLEAYNVEGRFGGMLQVEQTVRTTFRGPVHRYGATVRWMQPDDFRYLDPGHWEDAGTVEAMLHASATDTRNGWTLGAAVAGGAGIAYNRRGLITATGRDIDPFYGRGTLELTAGRVFKQKTRLGLRLYGGLATSGDLPAKQRQIYLAGADPIERFSNPFLRSRGALLIREDVNYHMTGGGNLRGFDSRLSAEGLAAANVELERTFYAKRENKLFNRVGLAIFGDLGRLLGERPFDWAADAGVGVRADHRIGQTRFTTRFDVPLFVNRPAAAQDADATDEKVGFRWLVSFEPGW
jgi:hypothetical protein